jgi:hypothetical protein
MTRDQIDPSDRARGSRASALGVGLLVVASLVAPARAEQVAQPPSFEVSRIIATTPFAGSRRSMQDNEGSAYVPGDRSLWMVDDEGQRIFVVDARTGALKRTIGSRALESVRRFGGGPTAGNARSRDLESVSYDAARDRLYAFSGSDCWPSTENCQVAARPTAFRLDRRAGRLQLHSYQPLPGGTNANAAAWNPGNRRTYIGESDGIRRYDYVRNRLGPVTRVAGVAGIGGMDFAAAADALVVSHGATMLSRVDWATRSLAGGWTVDLAPLHVQDARGVEVVGDRLLVSDGADDRPTSSPYRYGVFVLAQ